MGFFRFRRSIKLFPGVRWNIGKRSSSLSFGGPGAHYTVGSTGSRATIGIPGTGLSYTDFHSAHRRVASRHPRIPEPSEEWIRTNRINMTLHTPDRKPDEPPIRPDQTETIRQLLPDFDFAQLKDFGEEQADNLIDQIHYQQKEASKTLLKRFYAQHGHAIPDAFIDHCYDHPDKPWVPPRKKGHGCLILVGIFMLGGWLSSLATKEDSATSSSSSPSKRPAQLPATTSQSSISELPAPKYWPNEVRISAPVELSGTVGGGMIQETAKPGEVLGATLSKDHKTVILKRLDIKGSLPVGDTDFVQRARRAAPSE